MGMATSITLDKAKKDLKTCKEKIKKPKSDDNILHLTPSHDWKFIKSVKRITKKRRETIFLSETFFTKNGELSKLDKEGPTGTGNTSGIKWDGIIHSYLQEPGKNKNSDEIAKSLVKALQATFSGFTLLDSQFDLNGYMKNNDNDMIYLWEGTADAIAWYDGRYVIVDWKVCDLLGYWESNSGCGPHFHQCLVYAKLLQLHLNLPELPYILIVPISAVTGEDIHPGLFRKYHKDIEEKLKEFEWSIGKPDYSKVVDLNEGVFKESTLNVTESTRLKDLFADNATVKELKEAFGLPELIFKRRKKITKSRKK